MNILITGYDGFIGKNLYSHLNLLEDIDLILANRHNVTWHTKSGKHTPNFYGSIT